MALNPQYDEIGKTFVQQYYAMFDDPNLRPNLVHLFNVSIILLWLFIQLNFQENLWNCANCVSVLIEMWKICRLSLTSKQQQKNYSRWLSVHDDISLWHISSINFLFNWMYFVYHFQNDQSFMTFEGAQIQGSAKIAEKLSVSIIGHHFCPQIILLRQNLHIFVKIVCHSNLFAGPHVPENQQSCYIHRLSTNIRWRRYC